jgi:hypothetical protein
MPENKTIKRAQKAKREGKSSSTQAGAFVEEEMDHIREGKHGAKNTKQAIAIGLSKARKAGVEIPDKTGRKTASTGHKHITKKETSVKRSKAAEKRLQKEPHAAASHRALSLQAKRAAKSRGSEDRHEAAMKAVKTKGKTGLKRAAKKAASTRQEHKKAA